VTRPGGETNTATVNTFNWQSAYGVWYDDPHWTRGILLDYGIYTLEVGYDMDASGTLEQSEVQETCIVRVRVDLGIDSDYDGDIDGDDDIIETSAGGAVAINSDDDDWDDCVDRDETSSITGEDDLQRIALHTGSSLSAGTVKLETVYSGSGRIAIWEGSNKTTSISLTNTWNLATATVPSNLWIEGIAASTNGARDVELRLSYETGGLASTDTVAVTVGELFYASFGHSAEANGDYHDFISHVVSRGGVPWKVREYALIRDTSASFVVRIRNSQEGLKEALHAEGGYVALEAHANTGLGPAFDTTCTSISNFFNVGTPVAAVDYEWLHETYPGFSIASNEIAGGVTNYNTEQLGYERFPNLAYTNPPSGWPTVTVDVAVGNTFPAGYYLTGYDKMHYYGEDEDSYYPMLPTNTLTPLLVLAGSADKPTLKYKKLFLNQCRSGRRFSDVFSATNSVLFYNTDSENVPASGFKTLNDYFDAILNNKSNEETEAALDSGLQGDIYGHKEF